jgi:2-keto-4-pentenoate hydratase
MAPLPSHAVSAAAELLWRTWTQSARIDALPPDCRPTDRADGYAIQSALASLLHQKRVGWKIAATSVVGQRHIGVDGPLAGCYLANRVVDLGASRSSVSIAGNAMRVAEAEFGFRMQTALPPRERPYRVDEVVDAVASMHPTIEIPDSRYRDFASVGAPQLIADAACAWWLMVGPATPGSWRERDLSQAAVKGFLNGRHETTGTGSNVLDDPRIALTWVANELITFGEGLRAGDIVTTGTCIVPLKIAPGDVVRADFGDLGELEVECL